MSATRKPDAFAELAAIVQRLAVLLAGGVAPVSAWRHVAQFTGSSVVAGIGLAGDPVTVPAELVDAAAPLPALEARAWRGVAAAWCVAVQSGAPLAGVLRDLSSSLRDLAQVQRDVTVALAASIATARLVLVLPVVGVLFGLLLGFDTAAVLFTTPIGWGCLVAGGSLILAAVRWNRSLVASARPRDPVPGVACDLMAIAMRGGGAIDRARIMVVAALERFALPGGVERVDDVLALSAAAGVPAVELLRAEATEARREARAAAQEKAAALSVKLMLPLGACVLPAFVVVGVVPLMVALVSSSLQAF